MFAASPLGKTRFQSPPRRALTASSPAVSTETGLAAAQSREKSGFQFAKVALGLGLAAGALAACGTPVPPAAEAGAYQMEDAEVVVLNESIDRIDLARETDTVCTGIGEDETCVEVDEPYHPIGIHMGHGIVQDLNGNLFAAPQLAADQAPGFAVANPDSVFVDGPLFTEGRLSKTSEDTYLLTGSVFGGEQTISLNGKEAVVTARGLFGGQYETMRITHADGINTVSENRWNQQHVQSQGEHLLIQSTFGSNLGEIRHDKEAGNYTVAHKALFGSNYLTTANYGPEEYHRSSNFWGSSTFTVVQNQQGSHEVTINGGRKDYTLTPNGQSWTTKYNGLFGGTSEYLVRGGVALPGSGPGAS